MKIDLHTHTIFSDGLFTPAELVDVCVKDEIDVVAITDHDTINGIEPSIEAAKGTNVEIIPGVEINTIWGSQEVHILGYFMDLHNRFFQEIMSQQQKARIDQVHIILERLSSIAQINISFDDIISQTVPGGSIGRPHIAKAIYLKGGSKNIQDAYNKYINDNAPTYIKRATVSPHEAVEAVYEAGGIPVMAHPRETNDIEDLLKELMNYGLRGLEVYHKSHSPAIVEYHATIAEKLGLIVTGGSDCHGPKGGMPYSIGKNIVPEWIYKQLKREKELLDSAYYKA